MSPSAKLSAACLLLGVRTAFAAVSVHTADDYHAFVKGNAPSADFRISGTVVYILNPNQFIIDEGIGRLMIRHTAGEAIHAGDRVCTTGTITHHMPGDHATRTVWNSLHAESVRIIGKGSVPSPLESSPSHVVSGLHYLHEVRLSGQVESVISDDADPRWQIMIVREGADSVLVPLPAGTDYSELADARVAVTGLCVFNSGSVRHQSGWSIMLREKPKLEILESAETSILQTPRLTARQKFSPNAVSTLGRHRAVGTVLAVWANRFLLADDLGFVLRVETDDAPPPPPGSHVRVTGQPETDLYRINLSRAHVRQLETQSVNSTTNLPTLGATDIYDTHGDHVAFLMNNLGRPISVKGIVRSLPIPGVENSRLTLACGDIEIPADATACPEAFARLEPGATASISGILVFESENWRPSKPLPRVTGMFVSVSSPDAVILLSAPPWWTSRRLLVLAGGLILLLCGISVWTVSLRRLAERRGRALADAAIIRAKAELRIGERTRLAVELHDSIAQNLTGAALEIRTVQRDVGALPPDALQHLEIALKTINATREDVRNCIWDLRNRALEEPDFESAIRLTLEPLGTDIPIKVRFTAPRTRFSDATTHTILSIIRELTGNAIRHGNAKTVAIAGIIEGNRLLFSVKDDGCGFDPDTCPGQEQGHFGLQGVRERAKAFGGTVRISSNRKRGTRVSISVTLPSEKTT